MYPALYTVTGYDDVYGRAYTAKGVTFADTFAEAVEKIESFYGEEIISVFVELQEEQSIWELETSDS